MAGIERASVGVVGIGNMGAPMAANLLRAGFPVTVFDVRREAASPLEQAGAKWASSAADVARASDIVLTLLPSDSAAEATALGQGGILEGANTGLVHVEMSTNSRDTNLRIHERQSAAGIAMLEAPVSGGVAAAKAGSLAIWVGGDEQVFRRCEPILRILGGERVRLVGPFGAGMVTKLAHNCAIGAISVALAEIFAMATRAGADPVALWAAVRQGALGRRRTFDALGNHFLTGTFEPTGAPLRIVYKDMLLATQLARDVGAPMRSANLALADFQEAMLRGWGERDYSCAMALSLQRTNTAICGNRDEIETVLRNDPPN